MPKLKKKARKKYKTIPKPGEARYYDMKFPPGCGYEKKYRYSLSLGTYGVPAELIHWCIDKCKHKWGWWFKTNGTWYEDWSAHETNEAFMSFNSRKEAFKFWFEVGVKHYGDRDPDKH